MTTTPVGEDIDWNEHNRDKTIPIYIGDEIKEIIDFNGLDKTKEERRKDEIKDWQKLVNERIQKLMMSGKPITQDILNKMMKNMQINDELPM